MMRPQVATLSIMLFCLLLATVPTGASALTVTITTTVKGVTESKSAVTASASSVVSTQGCEDLTNGNIVGSPTGSPLSCSSFPGTTLVTVNTNTLAFLNAITFNNGFTITCSRCFDATGTPLPAKVIAQQTGSSQSVFVSNTTIFAPAAATPNPCSSGCTIQIIASADSWDFPTPVNAGPTPTGVVMSGSFRSPMVGDNTGDSIAVKGTGNGGDVINFINGGGAGDTPQSLPSNCAGSSGCAFPGSSPPPTTFLEALSENSQLACGGASTCTASAGATTTVTFGNAGNLVDFPDSIGVVRSTNKGSAVLVAQLLTPFDSFIVSKLDIAGLNPSTFQMDSQLTLNAASLGINLEMDTVTLGVGTFRIVFPPFAPTGNGSFTASGITANGVNFNARFSPLDTVTPHKRWGFNADVQNATGISPTSPELVRLTVRRAAGTELVPVSIE